MKDLESAQKEFTHAEYYAELTSRNKHFVSAQTQKQLSEIKVGIAGVGTIGGACTESLTRLGVQRFRLAEPDIYELTNLNRQKASKAELGQNKGLVQAQHIRDINPFADVDVYPGGIDELNVKDFVDWADIIIDGVDVTTQSGIQAKLLLHQEAHKAKRPTWISLDVGFAQWGYVYDYRKEEHPLNGKLQAAQQCKNPLKALFQFVDPNVMPDHVLEMVIECLNGDTVSQLGMAGDLLSSVIVPVVIRYVETGEAKGWNINFEQYAKVDSEVEKVKMRSTLLKERLSSLLERLD